MSTLEIWRDRKQRNVLSLQRLLVGHRGDRKRDKIQLQSCEQEQHMATFGGVGDIKGCELPMEPADPKKRQDGYALQRKKEKNAKYGCDELDEKVLEKLFVSVCQ